jgi:hypothetical protein
MIVTRCLLLMLALCIGATAAQTAKPQVAQSTNCCVADAGGATTELGLGALLILVGGYIRRTGSNEKVRRASLAAGLNLGYSAITGRSSGGSGD